MNVYEYGFGVYVAAESEQAAWEVVRPVSEALDAIDVEGASSTDGPFAQEMSEVNVTNPASPPRLAVLLSKDELAERMVKLAASPDRPVSRRFRGTIEGFAELALRALSES